MQGRSELDKKCGEVNSLLEQVALCDATPPSEIYSNLISALNELTNSLNKSFRASYRERLSRALSERVTKALNSKNGFVLSEERLGLEKVIKEVVILQGSGGFLRFSKQKTAAQAIQNLIVELDKAIANSKVEQFHSAGLKDDLVRIKQHVKPAIRNSTHLFEAAINGDLDEVKFLITSGVDVDSQDKDGCTALLFAAEEDSVDVVKYLIGKKANVNLADSYGETPISVAVLNGNLPMVEFFVANGAHLDGVTNARSSLLDTAICNNHDVVAEFLFKSIVQRSGLLLDDLGRPTPLPENVTIYSSLIAMVNNRESKFIPNFEVRALRKNIRTWLAAALTEKASVVVKSDLQNIEAELKGLHAIINEVDLLDGAGRLGAEKRAVTAIRKCIEILESALNQRKAVEAYPSKALLEAAEKGNFDIVKALIESGFNNINCQDIEGRTPLYLAAGKGHSDIVEFLIDQEADINQANNYGITPICIAALNGHKEVVQLLLENNAAVNQANNKGFTPLIVAAQYGHKEVVWLLLQNENVDVNQATNNGATPLYAAAYCGYKEIVQVLLQNDNVAVNQPANDGATPLYAASYHGRTEVVEVLLQNDNVAVNQTFNGFTPLYTAIDMNHVAIVNLFKDHLNKKIRLHLFEENKALAAAPQCYDNLIAYLNHQCILYKNLKSIRKTIRLFLTTALHERVNDIMTPAKPDYGLLKNEKAGLDLMIQSLELLQPTGSAPTKKHAMKEIEAWSAALGLKIEQPEAMVTIHPPRAQKQSLTGAVYATLFGGGAPRAQFNSEQAIVPSRLDGSAQAFHSAL